MDYENTFDNSQINCYQACPRKYYYQYIKGLVKSASDKSNMDMEFGRLTHAFLEAYYQKKPVNLNELWAGYEDREDQLAKTRANGIALCQRYHEENARKDQDIEILEVEKVAELDIDGIQFVVKSDAVIKLKENIYGFEHKTTNSLNYNYFDRFFLNSQPSAQCYSVKERYGSCSGIYYNAIEIKWLKRKSKDRDAGLNFKFRRNLIDRNGRELSDWRSNMVAWAEKINQSKKNEIWLINDSGQLCSMFNGCTYKELCKSGGDEQIEETLYEQTDPYGYLKE